MGHDDRQLRVLVEPIVTAMGFELVRVAMLGGAGERALQVMAEDPNTGQLTLDQCAEISRKLSDLLDEADPIDGEYRLEVSSPGIDRPLTRAKDWANWIGHDARVQLRKGGEGQKRFAGAIRGIDGEVATIDAGAKGEVSFALGEVDTAKLVLTDALIRATRPLSTAGAEEIEEEDDQNG